MYVVTVDFAIDEGRIAEFMPLMRENARRSLAEEPGCVQFDVCVDPQRAGCVFLYELYHDRAAFEAHLATAHYRSFDAATRSMIVRKDVRLLERAHPASSSS